MSQRHRVSLVALTALIASVLLPGATAQELGPQDPSRPGSAPQTGALEGAAPQPAGARLYLPVVMNRWIKPMGPTSNQLIDQALARGEINAETALTYKVFAAFGDARLPAAYKGDDSRLVDSHIVAEVQARYGELSAATRAVLDPFLIPPVYEGSWADAAGVAAPATVAGDDVAPGAPGWTPPSCEKLQAGKWDHADGLHARFWWRKSQPELLITASSFMRELDGTIWPALTELMGHAPLPDTGNACGGGNAKLDVYLDRSIDRSYSAAHNSPGCKQTSSFIVLNPRDSNSILAHEFMHAIQWGYLPAHGCVYPGEYAWLAEATATWAEDFVYPKANEEHYTAEWFFWHTEEPSLDLRNDMHEYGAYLFFFFAVRRMDDPELVRRVWDNVGAMDSLEAVDGALLLGLDWWWDEFAKANVNVPPYNDYEKWDGQTVRPESYNGDRIVQEAGTWVMDADVPHLGLIYQRFKFTGEKARLVTFANGLTKELGEEPFADQVGITYVGDGTQKFKWTDLPPEEVEGARIYGFFKIEGNSQWQYEDWTDKKWVSFCRDVKAERLEELVIVFSYKQWDDLNKWVVPVDQQPTLQVSDMGCWRYKGTASFDSQVTGSDLTVKDFQQADGLVFERRDAHPDIPYPFLTLEVAEGQWQRTITYSGGCTGSQNVQGPLGGDDSVYDQMQVITGATQGPSMFRYLGHASAGRTVSVTVSCPEHTDTVTSADSAYFSPSYIGNIIPGGVIFSANPGGALKGSVDYPLTAGSYWRWDWTLQPEREP